MKNLFFKITLITISTISIFSCSKSDDNSNSNSGGNAIATSWIGSTSGDINATGTAAKLNEPEGIVIAPSGIVYVVDTGNNKIKKITPEGVVTTLAGTGDDGDVVGAGNVAQFSSPNGITMDVDGNLYITDVGNYKIKKITPAGVVSNFAGGSFSDFGIPFGITIDAAKNLYVCDASAKKIKKVTPAGVISTFAGTGASGETNGPGNTATFQSPNEIVIDGSGNLFVADGNKIRKITSTGVVSTFKTGISENANQDGDTEFFLPGAMAINSAGDIYFESGVGSKVKKITPSGEVSTIIGSSNNGDQDGKGSDARFFYPQGIAISASGVIYLSDTNNNKIKKITEN